VFAFITDIAEADQAYDYDENGDNKAKKQAMRCAVGQAPGHD